MISRRVLRQLENQFGSFVVEELIYEGRSARVLFSGPLRSAQSGLALDGNPRLLFDYNQQLFELAVELSPKNILVLGGGTLTLPMALIKQLPKARVTAVEINPDLIKIAEDYFDYRPSPRLNVIVDDATHFIAESKPRSYELIITDLFDNLAIPEACLSLDFAQRLNRLRTNGGVVATNCIAALTGSGAWPLLQLVSSYQSAIGSVKVVRADQRRYMNWTPQNLLVLAGKDADSLLKGLIEVQID